MVKRKRVTAPRMSMRRVKPRFRPRVMVQSRPLYLKGPLKNQQTVKLKYAQNIVLNPQVAGIPAVAMFRANSMYEPSVASGGTSHQPRGFDQLMNLYKHFVVTGAKVTLTCHNNDALSATIVSCLITNQSTPIDGQFDILENQRSKHVLCGPRDSGSSTKTLVYKANPTKYLGYTSPMNEVDLQGNIAGNPDDQCYFQINAFPIGNSDNAEIDIYVEIEFSAILLEQREPAQS